MQRHAELTRERLDRFTKELVGLLYSERQDVDLMVYDAPGRISYDEAVRGNYHPIQLWDRLVPPWSTHWFRLDLRIPETWRGQEVHLRWDSSSEACIWRDGQPVKGLSGSGDYWHSPYHESWIVTERARGGEAEQVYIETAVNTPFGVDPHIMPPQLGVLRKAELAVFRRDIWDFLWDYVTVADMAQHLPRHAPRAGQALAAANEMVNLFRPDEPDCIAEARDVAARFLSKRNGEGQHVVYAAGHAHIDTAWLWPLDETRRKCVRTFSTALYLMERYPDYRFVCSQAQQLAWIKESHPELYGRIRQRAAEGRFIPVGGSWVEPDCNIPSGESLVRQFLYGQRFFEREFGQRCREFWLPDTFGYPGALPQIMRGAGIDSFISQKLSWNQFNKPPASTFHWESPDGSRVLAHFPPTDTYNGLATVEELLHGLQGFKDHDRSDASLYLYGYGDGGGGPSEGMLERLSRMRDVDGLPRLEMAGSEPFLQRAAEARDLTTWVGELYFEMHRGTYTTQAATKRNNRQSELLLRDIEFLSAVGPDYPREALDGLWRIVLLNQFHDILPGSSINEVYRDADRDYAQVFETGMALREYALEALPIETGGGIAVVNTLNQPRREVVALPLNMPGGQTAADGRGLAVVSAPPMGYRVGPVETQVEQPATIRERDGGFVLENATLRATIGRDGRLTSLFDKALGREALAGHGNQFVLFEDKPVAWDAWDVDAYHLETRRPCSGAIAAEIIEAGPLRVAVRFDYALTPASTLRQTVLLDCESPCLVFDTEADWHERHQFLKVEFPLAVRTQQATYETQYGLVQRPTHSNTSWDMARFEVCAHRWGALAEYGFGVALLNDCKYGYSARGNILSLSLLRSPSSPDPAADQGRHAFRYALLPYDGRAEVLVAAGLRFNVPLLVRPAADLPVERSYFSVEPASVVIDAVKRAEDSDDFIVRLYESCGGRACVTLRSTLDVAAATRCNLLEEDEGALQWAGGATSVELGAFELVTLKLKMV